MTNNERNQAGLEDLSARARRRELGDEDLRQLSLLLERSLEARLLHRAGLEFDAEDCVLPGDEQLAERIGQRWLREHRPAPLRRRRLWALLAAAMTISAVTIGAPLTARRGGWWPFAQPAEPALSSAQGRVPAAPVKATAKRSGPAAMAETEPAASTAPALPVARPTPGAPEPSAMPNVVRDGKAAFPAFPEATAAELNGAAPLFAQANRLRREGHVAEAVKVYETLVRRHPGSAEAKASAISLGMLELGRGSARAALRHFQRSLAESPNGDLAPEALWGQAQAFSRLGEQAQARESYAVLLKNYPGSAYANAARARLQGEH